MTDESTYLTEKRSELIAHRLLPFSVGWLGASAIWLLVFVLEGRPVAWAVALTLLQAAILAMTMGICRRAPAAPRVVPVTTVASVLLGLTSMELVLAVGAYGEILAFMLLTLYVAAALLFSWGWRAELALLVATLGPWGLALGRFTFFVPLAELAAAVSVGTILAIAIAEGTARNVRAVLRRRRAQEEATHELQISRDAYRDIAEHARDMIWAADLEGRLTYANEALMRFLGLPQSEVLGRSIRDFHTDNPRNPDFLTTITRVLSDEALPMAVECATPRGPRWVEWVSSVVHDRDGAPVGFRGISRDIQERHDAEVALRQSEERFRSAFDHAAIGKLVVGMDAKPIEVNRAFLEMLGYSLAELQARTIDTLTHPDDVERTAVGIMRLLHGEIGAVHAEKRYLHKDGHVVWCLVSVSLAHDELGQPLHFIAQVQDISERKAAEDALRASEARYRGLVESQHELVVRMGADGRFTFVNEAYATKFGRTPQELIGRSFMDFVHPDDRERIAGAMVGMAKPPHRTVIEIRNLTVEGVRWVAWEGGIVTDVDGRMVEAQAVGRDVSERRASEDALRASEARYRGLVESASDLVTRFDRQGNLTFANDSYCETIGYPRESIIGRNTLFLVHPDDRAGVLASVRAATQPPFRARHESRGLTPSGWRWFEWELSGVRDESGEVVEVQQVGRDLTARRQAEADLRESEERFRRAFDDAAIGMAVSTLDGRTVRVNPALCEMLGYSEEELLACSPADVVHPDDLPALEGDRARLAGDGARSYRAERRYLRKDGGVVWVHATASIVRDGAGIPLYVIGQIQDITERHLAEDALRDSLAELRRSEEKLRLLAQRQAVIREEERKRLGFDLHDDVCQELVGVGILVESLRRKLAPMPAAHAAEFDRVVRYLGEVVEHLRLLARELRPMLLRDLGLDGTLRSLADGMTSATLQVTTEFATEIPRLDEELEVTVYRVAQEALANAVRHAGAHRIAIVLAIVDGLLTLEVRDDGRGFDPTVRPVVALGLASMEERTLALGGRFEIRSQPGQGTTVALACPLETRTPGRFRELGAPSPTRSSSPLSTTTTPRSAARD